MAPEPVRAAVVIVNYGFPELTLRCLASLSAGGPGSFAVFLVDNSPGSESSDELRQGLAGTGLDHRYIASTANRGFGDGANQGFRAAMIEGFSHLILLNNDATVAPDFGARLLEEISRHPRDVLAGLVIDADTGQPTYNIGRFTPWTLGIEHLFGREENPPLDFVSGCFTIFPAVVLQSTGLFREDYFMYAEDAELCLRLREAGVSIRFCPSLVVAHRHGSSADRIGMPKRYYLVRNHAHMVFLRGGPVQKIVYPPYMLAVLASQIRSRERFSQILGGLWDALRGRMGRRGENPSARRGSP